MGSHVSKVQRSAFVELSRRFIQVLSRIRCRKWSRISYLGYIWFPKLSKQNCTQCERSFFRDQYFLERVVDKVLTEVKIIPFHENFVIMMLLSIHKPMMKLFQFRPQTKDIFFQLFITKKNDFASEFDEYNLYVSDKSYQ